MEEKSISDSNLPSSYMYAEMKDGWYPMYVGVSCALFALKLLSGRNSDSKKLSELCNKMLQGSTYLFGLHIWRAKQGRDEGKYILVQKLEVAERKIEELRRIRHEDAKANEKVVGIFASKEQSWFSERKKLKQHIGGLVNELRVVGRKKDQAISELNKKLSEMEILMHSKDKALEEEEMKWKEMEENCKKVENLLEEMRETAKRISQEHSTEIWKHKTAFIELVSNQRQLEAEMGRAMRQLEATKQELGSVMEQKAESIMMVQKLSAEMVKMQKDVEQKDQILSAMLRKSKLDSAEKQMLLKEVKLSNAKRKQAELEKERCSKQGGSSLRSMLQNQMSFKSEGSNATRKTHSNSAALSHSKNKDAEIYPHEENGVQAIAADADLENWVHTEAEKYASLIERRHHLETESFVEQMRLKDEKLEAFRWRLLSMEIESKRLRSHIEILNKDIAQLERSNMKLEALLLDREEELSSVKEQFLHFANNPLIYDSFLSQGAVWSSKLKIVKKRAVEREKSVDTLAESNNGSEVISSIGQHKDSILTIESPDSKIGIVENSPVQEQSSSSSEKSSSPSNFPWRMDLHALGVSYKIKRLNQQLLMLERLIGNQGSTENIEDGNFGGKGIVSLMSLLNKQVSRYQSLQEKTDSLCKRMHDNGLCTRNNDSNPSSSRNRGETKTLERFLDETFQLQRYMVATGQKLMEIQSKVAAWFNGEMEMPLSFDRKRFSDSLRTLLQEVQRGIEVRISRIIGDLEGPLASDGIRHLRR